MDIYSKYKIVKELGSQKIRKFGRVFLISENTSGTKYVLKALQRNPGNEQIARRIINEAHFSFNFAGLPIIKESFVSDTEILLVLEYKNGVELDTFWNSVSKRERISTLKQLILALIPIYEHLRLNRFVHCDIKPSNILIDRQGESIKAHIIDFGLAIDLNHAEEHRKILFPLGYAAPELVLNKIECIDHTSDIFSLGIVIWKLVAGKLPLIHPNPSIFTNLQITHPLPENPNIPKDLYKILAKMSFKHTFKTAPNRLKEDEIIVSLKEANSLRYQSLKSVYDDLIPIQDKKTWFNGKGLF